MKQSDVDKKLADRPTPKKFKDTIGEAVAKKVPYRPLVVKKTKKKSNARPPKGYIWERVADAFSGKVVTPKTIAGRYKVDRAYACRVLQSLVRKGLAYPGGSRGEYKIGI